MPSAAPIRLQTLWLSRRRRGERGSSVLVVRVRDASARPVAARLCALRELRGMHQLFGSCWRYQTSAIFAVSPLLVFQQMDPAQVSLLRQAIQEMR